MSFILDALKKSEIERQRQTVPGLMDTGMSRRRSHLPIWALLLGALLIVNVVVLLVVLMRNGTPAAGSAAVKHAQAPSAAPKSGGAEPAAHFSPLDSAPVYAPEIPVPAASAPVAAQRAAAAESETAPRISHRPDPVLSAEEAPDNDEVLPSISEINLTGAQALPELHLDVHVFATKPSDRFVYINMRKYHEGAVLQEGPTVERIRRDGVVLDIHGLRFLLPRQS